MSIQRCQKCNSGPVVKVGTVIPYQGGEDRKGELLLECRACQQPYSYVVNKNDVTVVALSETQAKQIRNRCLELCGKK